jgi:capsule biosynthesis phosphatase
LKSRKKFKIICFDLDNVICFTNKEKNYLESKPNKKVINFINSLYDKKKFIIKVYTARGMSKYKGNLNKINKNYKNLTKSQLKNWGLRYDELILGKAAYDYFVDDKAVGFNKNWMKTLKKLLS